MSYMAAQALLKTLLLTCSSFGSSDVTEGNYRTLDRGSTNLAVLVPGNLPEYDTAGMIREHQYEGCIDLFVKFTGDEAYSNFGTLRDAVIATIAGAPCLSATYFITALAGEGEPVEVYDKAGAGPFFITQRLRVTIMEQV